MQQPEQRKVNSTIPSNFQTPNFFVDQLLHLLDPKEWIVLSFVTRHIFGWHDKVDSRTATISITMIEKGFSFENGSRLHGCGLSRPTIIAALDKLSEFKILERVGEPTADGQRWRIPENDAQVDYDGLQKRLDDKFSKDQSRTKKGSKKSAERRAEKKTAGKSDLPDNSSEVVNGIYQDRYVAFTGAGKSDLRNHIQDHIQEKTNTPGSVTVVLLPPTDPLGMDDPLPKEQQDLINLAKAENRLTENKPDDQQFSIPTVTPQGQEPILRKALSAGLEVQNTDPITPIAPPPSFPSKRTIVLHVSQCGGPDTLHQALINNPNLVYIGRANPSWHLPESIWHNPFKIPQDGDREQVITKYREYLLSRPDLMSRTSELKGKQLLCWCSPQSCHGDVLAELADSLQEAPPATPPKAVEASPMPQNENKAVLAPDSPIQLDAWYVDAPGGVFGPYPSYEAVKRGADELDGRITQGQAIKGKQVIPVDKKVTKPKAERKRISLSPLQKAIGTCLLKQTSEATMDANRPRINTLQRIILTCENYSAGVIPDSEQSQALADSFCLKFIPWYEAETLKRYGKKNDLPAGNDTLPKWYGEWVGLGKPGTATTKTQADEQWMPQLV